VIEKAREPLAEPPWLDEPAIGQRPRATDLGVLSWSDILAGPNEPPPQIATGIPKVGLTVLAGPPKVGKTLYASQIGLEIPGASFVIEEGDLAGLSFRLRRQAAAMGVGRPDVEVLHRQRIRLDDRASVRRLKAYVAARRPPLLTLDPLNRLHSADENRPTQMTPVMDALAGIAYDYGIAVLAIHHLAKPSIERRGDVWDRFRGASSIRSGTDANLVLDGTGPIVRLYGEFRDAEPLSDYLELDRETLTFRQVDGPKGTSKVDLDALRVYVTEEAQVTVASTAIRFGVTKPTARVALEQLSGIDWYDGPRGARFYTLKDR
jgi:hypothetical protein